MDRRFFLFLIFAVYITLFPCSYISAQDSIEIERIKTEGVQHAMNGNFDEAESAFNSIFLLDSNSIIARNNLGVLYKRLGRYNDALRVYFDGEHIIGRDCGESCQELAKIYNNIGIIYNQKQDYELAIQYLNFAENLFRDAGIQTFPANSVYNNIGNSYFGMNEFRKALQSYQIGIEAKLATDKRNIDISYANCASSYENLGKLDSASMYYNYSIESKIARYGGPDKYQLIETYNNYGILLQKMGEIEQAYHYLSKALNIARANYSEKHPDLADCYERLASMYYSDGEFEKALEYYQLGINAVVFDYRNTDIYDNPGIENEIISDPILLEILMGKAAALDKLYMKTRDANILLSSLETLDLASMLTEKMRSTYLGEGSKLLITGFAREGFDRSIRTSYNLYKLTGDAEYADKAFISAEKGKSSVLLASLQQVERKKNLGISSELQVLEQDLKRETDIYKKKLYEERQRLEPNQDKLTNFQEKLFYLSQQLDSLDQIIREQFPEYAEKYNNEVIDLSRVMERLDDDQVLIEYSLCDTCLFIFVVSKEDFLINHLPIDSAFRSNIDILSRFLRNNRFNNNTINDYRTYLDAAYSLYKIFLQPLEGIIDGKKLLIIPDGELGYIPFEALLTSHSGGETMDYRTLPYLIYKYRTNYSYSATLFFSDDGKRKEAQEQLLAFAPTYENVEDIDSDKFPANRDFSTYLVPLRYISSEIQNISQIVECNSYEGYEATEQVFKEKAPQYDILHLAMHTLINDENPMYSQLVFTLNNDTIEENDGLLNAYEIFNMQLSARMAVLSACNTGYGKLQRGEGIMSMARGFIHAGVPSIIMTLWAVEDQSGSILMSKFYQNLVEGMEIDEALQEAKLQYIQEADQVGAHPYLWSGYVCIGSTDALIEPGINKIYQLIIAIVGLIVIIALFIRFRKRKSGV